MPAPITTALVWNEIQKRMFAVLSWVTPKGEARSAGIVYLVKDGKLYIATGNESWKAKHIRKNPNVALNITIPKRIPFLPWIAIPDATIAFHGKARVLAHDLVDPSLVKKLEAGMADDPQRLAESCMLEVTPAGHFVTYGVGVPLMAMRDPKKAMGRVAVG